MPSHETAQQETTNPGVWSPVAEAELQTGIQLTLRGQFLQAIPHFLAARGRVRDEYAAGFNLALCYVATGDQTRAMPLLREMVSAGSATADVYSLLAQAQIGDGNEEEAWLAAEQGARLEPKSEKFYVFVADACADHHRDALGLRIVNLGLKNLPASARLYYERGVFDSSLDQMDLAGEDLNRAAALAPGTGIAYLAISQRALMMGDVPSAMASAREGIRAGFGNYLLLTILGESLLRAGAQPGAPGFDEAAAALEKSVTERGNYARSQLALGKVNLLSGQLDGAVAHFERARALDPGNPAVYSQLAVAYRRRGDAAQAAQMLAVLAQLNEQQQKKVREASPDRIGSSIAAGVQ
ncbi:MAG: tetratricopeptide repeat protein [Candidatus Acidiferrales bacterium]